MSVLNNCKHIDSIEYDEMDSKLDPIVKKRIEDHLNKRMREETENKFSRDIKLEKTDGVVEIYEDTNGEKVYEYLTDCDEYVFCAEIIFGKDVVEERDFGTSLSEWL